jgi:DNA-binding IclR family transcriptional regulator
MTKSMVHRGLTTLVKHNYLVRDNSGARYQLGYALAEFGTLSMRAPDIHQMCRPVMTELHELTGETISLHIPVEAAAVCIDGIEGLGPVSRRVPLGQALPLHISPAARALLAYLPEEELAWYLQRPLEVVTSHTLSRPEDVRADVKLTRSRGFALGLGDSVPRTIAKAVSFPVLDMNGEPHAAITVAGPADRFDAARIQELLPAMLTTMGALTREGRLYLANRNPVPAPPGHDDV